MSRAAAAALMWTVVAASGVHALDAPAADPVLGCAWSPADAPEAGNAPEVVPFRGGHALCCSSARQTRVDLGQGRDDCLRLKGPLSLAAE